MASVTSLGVHEPSGLRFAVAEGILPANAGPESYDWKSFDDENGEDELFITKTCVIWSRGGAVGRCHRFDIEQEPVATALFAYFPTTEDDFDREEQGSPDQGRFSAPQPDKNRRPDSKPDRKDMPPPHTKSLIVFLRTRAHVYSLSGGEYIVHMPFEVESAMAAPRGVIIQRKSKIDKTVPITLRFPRVPPSSFVSSQILPPQLSAENLGGSFSTAGLGRPMPLPSGMGSTLDNMCDAPLESSAADFGWPRLVCLTDPMSELGLVVAQPDKPPKDRYPRTSSGPRTPFLDPAEEILHIEAIKQHHPSTGKIKGHREEELILAVTVNRDTSMYSVWRMSYLNPKDQLTRRINSSKAPTNAGSTKDTVAGVATGGGNRRRSSMAPNLAAGSSSLRESMGPPQPMKRTRKSERIEKLSEKERDKDMDQNMDAGALEKALSMDTDRTSDSRRQSRRISSHLARADLSASHERTMFPDGPGLPAGSGAASTTAGRRTDPHGNQRGRNSSGFGASAGGVLHFNHTLNSLLESPVDGLLEELRSGGDFEGFHNMDLEDPEFDGMTKEILFTKIHSMSMDTTNLRYSLLNRPAAKLCKVFFIIGTPYSVDERDRNYLLVCIQDIIDKRLQLLTLHVQVRSESESTATATPANPNILTTSTSITWGQHRKAQNVADSCVIHDGSQSMIFILSEGDNGQRQLSIQAPWSELTTISIPPLSMHNRDLNAIEELTTNKLPKTNNESGVSIKGLRYPRRKGVVDVVDEHDRLHQIRIQLEPRSARVRQVLNVLRSILPASHAEKIVLGWWHMMQWLGHVHDNNTRPRESTLGVKQNECTALAAELCMIFLAAMNPGSAQNADQSQLPFSENSTGRTRPRSPCPAWATTSAWSWAARRVLSDADDDPLAEPIFLARGFMATEAGEQAIGRTGYLPTALGASEDTRRKAVWGIALALHLLVEEDKLDIMSNSLCDAMGLKTLVHRMCLWLKWTKFEQFYALELPRSGTQYAPSTLGFAVPEPETVPIIFDWVRKRLVRQTALPFLSLRDIYAVLAQQDPKDAQRDDALWQEVTPRSFIFRRFFETTSLSGSSARIVESMHRCGFTPSILASLPEGMATPFYDVITRCQNDPPSHWSSAMYDLVGRSDLNTVLKVSGATRTDVGNLSIRALYGKPSLDKNEEEMAATSVSAGDPESEERQAVIQALFREDKRLFEAQNLLSSTKPRVLQLNPQPEWSESEYLERQKDLATTIATSTLSTSAGRGMLNYGFRFPLLTQKFNVQGFNLTCIVKPTNVSVSVDKHLFTEERVNWAFFHQGVAYGLAISSRAKGIDTSWIVFNRSGADLTHRHAGFLLALGLNGHLKQVAKWVAFKYLTPKHTMTSIGLLLGLAVSHLGTMDSLITRLMSVHVTRMLPRGAAELNVSPHIQTTGIMGIGLLYYNSQHRRMSETMMSEIEYMGDEDEGNPLRNEGYRLAAAFALGFINLGCGGDRKGLLDMHITDKLLSLASSTKKVEFVNVLDRAAPAATIAIALIYMKTEDHIVARKIDIPASSMQFDYVRPDVLLLRTLTKHLIMWSEIRATPDWIRDNLPVEFRERFWLDDVRALRTQELPFFSIIAGLCFAIALRFVGTGNTSVRDLLVHYLDQFIHIANTTNTLTFDARLARGGARMCLDVLALCCATVMAGTGDIKVLRRLRLLHGRQDMHTTYGSHMAAHLAIGALFLGSGTTTFGNSNLATAALLVAFYPIFPVSIQDNDSHLQAFRHLWVLATEPRCLVTIDAATGKPVSVPILIYLDADALSMSGEDPTELEEKRVQRWETPCLLPPLKDILAIRTDAATQGFWDLEVSFEHDPSLREAFRANQSLYLKRRPAHESAFVTNLQALTRSAMPQSLSVSDLASNIVSTDPLDWVLRLDMFRTLTRAERAKIIGGDGDPTDGGISSGVVSNISNALDARLALARSLSADWGRDQMQDLRLLFDWAERRNWSLGGSGTKEKLRPWPTTDEADAEWWMSDEAIDRLKGLVWLAGQEE